MGHACTFAALATILLLQRARQAAAVLDDDIDACANTVCTSGFAKLPLSSANHPSKTGLCDECGAGDGCKAAAGSCKQCCYKRTCANYYGIGKSFCPYGYVTSTSADLPPAGAGADAAELFDTCCGGTLDNAFPAAKDTFLGAVQAITDMDTNWGFDEDTGNYPTNAHTGFYTGMCFKVGRLNALCSGCAVQCCGCTYPRELTSGASTSLTTTPQLEAPRGISESAHRRTPTAGALPKRVQTCCPRPPAARRAGALDLRLRRQRRPRVLPAQHQARVPAVQAARAGGDGSARRRPALRRALQALALSPVLRARRVARRKEADLEGRQPHQGLQGQRARGRALRDHPPQLWGGAPGHRLRVHRRHPGGRRLQLGEPLVGGRAPAAPLLGTSLSGVQAWWRGAPQQLGPAGWQTACMLWPTGCCWG